jgi:hypothetical protein
MHIGINHQLALVDKVHDVIGLVLATGSELGGRLIGHQAYVCHNMPKQGT